MYLPQTVTLFIEIILTLATIWVAADCLQLAKDVAGEIRKKRSNGVDVGDFDVICIGFDTRNDGLLPKELAILKNFMESEINQFLTLNEERRY